MSKQLLKELPGLVNAGVISQQTAENIIEHYQQKKQASPNNFIVILSILGALLTGSGILLIVAHNWDDLSVPVKTILSFLPLLLAQLTGAYTLLRRKSDIAWRECSSLFIFFTIGACIALISQIYQVNGTLSGFLLTWVFLSMPLIYILSANTLALFCISAITWYASLIGYFESYRSVPFLYLIVLALMAPNYYKLYKNRPDGNFYTLTNWWIAISVTITLGCFVSKETDLFEWLFLLYCMLFCIYYFIGRSSLFESKRIWANPFLVIGALGIIVTLLTWSFSFIWKEYKLPATDQVYYNPLFYLLASGSIIILMITWKNLRLQTEKLPDPLGYSVFVLLILLLTLHDEPSLAAFIVNAWTIIISIFFIRKGSIANHLGIVNFGLIIIAALAVCRFFDEKIPFVWRGIFFLATGVAFFAANYLLIRKRKQFIKSS